MIRSRFVGHFCLGFRYCDKQTETRTVPVCPFRGVVRLAPWCKSADVLAFCSPSRFCLLLLLSFVEMSPREKNGTSHFPLITLSQQAHEDRGRPSRAVWKRLYQPISLALAQNTSAAICMTTFFFMIRSSWNGLRGLSWGRKRELLSPRAWADANFSPRTLNKRHAEGS